MSATNSFSGKFQEGTFANGEGPIHGLEIRNEEERKGVLGGTDKDKLHAMSGQGADGLMDRSEEPGFDIYGAKYKGPQNMTPKNMGVVPNFDINK